MDVRFAHIHVWPCTIRNTTMDQTMLCDFKKRIKAPWPEENQIILPLLDKITDQKFRSSLTYENDGLVDAVLEIIATAAYEQWIKTDERVVKELEPTMKRLVIDILKSRSTGITPEERKALLENKILQEGSECTVSPKIILSLKPMHAFQNLRVFAFAVLHSLNPVFLQRTKTQGKMLEYTWQQEFYRAATSILPPEMHITPEYTVTGHRRVDFTVEKIDENGTAKIQWCIELIHNAKCKDLNTHTKRFEKGKGPYSKIADDLEFIVIDFYCKKKRKSMTVNDEFINRVWFVEYNETVTTMNVQQWVQQQNESEKAKRTKPVYMMESIKVIDLQTPQQWHSQSSLQKVIYQKCMDLEIETCHKMQGRVQHILQNGELSDDDMNAAMRLIKSTTPTGGLHDYPAQGKTLPNTKGIIVQILRYKTNWFTIQRIYSVSATVLVHIYDSKFENITDDDKKKIAELVGTPNFKYTMKKTQLNKNGSNSGLFAIAFATDLVRNKPISCEYDEEKLRHHLISCFMNHSMEQFPRK